MIDQCAYDFDFEVRFIGTRIAKQGLRSGSDRRVRILGRGHENILRTDEGCLIVIERVELSLSNHDILFRRDYRLAKIFNASGIRGETGAFDRRHECFVGGQRFVERRTSGSEILLRSRRGSLRIFERRLRSSEIRAGRRESIFRCNLRITGSVQRIEVVLRRIVIEGFLRGGQRFVRIGQKFRVQIDIRLSGVEIGERRSFGVSGCITSVDCSGHRVERSEVIFGERSLHGFTRSCQFVCFSRFGIDNGLRCCNVFVARSGLSDLAVEIVVSAIESAAKIVATGEDVSIFSGRIITNDRAVGFRYRAGFLRGSRRSDRYRSRTGKKSCGKEPPRGVKEKRMSYPFLRYITVVRDHPSSSACLRNFFKSSIPYLDETGNSASNEPKLWQLCTSLGTGK